MSRAILGCFFLLCSVSIIPLPSRRAKTTATLPFALCREPMTAPGARWGPTGGSAAICIAALAMAPCWCHAVRPSLPAQSLSPWAVGLLLVSCDGFTRRSSSVIDPYCRHLSSSPVLGGGHSLAAEPGVAQGFVDLTGPPEAQEQHTELAGHGHHCILRAKPATHSNRRRPPIPRQSGHPFRPEGSHFLASRRNQWPGSLGMKTPEPIDAR